MIRQSRSARIFLYEKSAVWHRREKDTVLCSGTIATCTGSSAQYHPALFQNDSESAAAVIRAAPQAVFIRPIARG
jgi:hypothetical protein